MGLETAISVCAQTLAREAISRTAICIMVRLSGERCVISGVTLDGQSVPADTVLHGLKLQDGRFVVRMYGVCDNPKEAALFGKKIGEPLWTAAIRFEIRFRKQYLRHCVHMKTVFPTLEDGISLKDSFNQADVTAICPAG